MPPGPLTCTALATWSPTRPLVATALDTGAVTLNQWHPSFEHLEELVFSTPGSAPICSLRFSVDGTRLQVLTSDNTEHILDAATLEPGDSRWPTGGRGGEALTRLSHRQRRNQPFTAVDVLSTIASLYL